LACELKNILIARNMMENLILLEVSCGGWIVSSLICVGTVSMTEQVALSIVILFKYFMIP
jgi:hypothetical protein